MFSNFNKNFKSQYLSILILLIIDSLYFLSGQSFLVFLIFTGYLYICIHYKYDFRDVCNPIILFMMYSFLLWFLPFLLIKQFSTFIIKQYIYDYTVIGFSILFIVFLLFSTKDFKKPLDLKQENNKFLFILGGLGIVVSFVFTSLFFIKAGNIPIFAENPEVARVNAMKGNGMVHRISYISLSIGALGLTAFDYFKYKKVRITTILIILSLVVYNSLTGPRSQSLKVLIQMYLFYMVLKSNKIKLSHFAFLGTILLTATGVLGAMRGGKEGIIDGFFHLMNRLYMNPINFQRIVEMVKSDGFWYGKSLIYDFSVYLPGSQPNLGTVLKQQTGAKFDGGGITVTSLGEGYLNFGIAGIIIYSVLAGLIFALIYVGVQKPLKVSSLILLILLNTSLMGIISMGIFPVLAADTVPTVVVFTGLFITAQIITNKYDKINIKKMFVLNKG